MEKKINKTSTAEKKPAAKKTSGNSKKSKDSKNKFPKVLLKILVVIVVLFAAWYLGGKPKVEYVDGTVLVATTEEPIIDFVALRQQRDDLLNSAKDGNLTGGAPATVTTTASASEASKPAASASSGDSKSGNGTSGSSAKADQGHAENSPLFFGNPTDALAETSLKTNYLMVKPQYTLSYNSETLCPNWAAWHLGSEDMGEADRCNDFRPDEELPSDWYAVKKADYQYNAYGFDRGHVCPSADRTATMEDNSMTFLMTNMVPQSPDNNRVIWMHFEKYERELVKDGNEVYIIAGPYGSGGTSGKGTFNEIPVKLKSGEVLHMNVPATTWKVCLVLPEGQNDISRVTKDTTVIAINVPNEMGMGKTGDWEQFLTSVDEIERITGYDFFELLPDDVEEALESKVYSYSK